LSPDEARRIIARDWLFIRLWDFHFLVHRFPRLKHNQLQVLVVVHHLG
jgi:hypothetical protein